MPKINVIMPHINMALIWQVLISTYVKPFSASNMHTSNAYKIFSPI